MSVTLAFRLEREVALTAAEDARIDEVLAATDHGHGRLVRWAEPGADQVAAGSGDLPRDTGAMTEALWSWCDDLAELALSVDGRWTVHVGDVEIPWDPEDDAFRPDQAGP